jgi:hypothetical protein
MKAFAAITLLVMQVGLPTDPDVDVDAVPWSPAVKVDVRDVDQGQADQPVDAGAPAAPPSEPPCYQAPGAAASGFSCALETFPGTFSPLPADGDATPADIERAIREVPMPPLRLHVQPDGRTLVNVDTIFYTEPTTMRRTVALLGHSVRLECTPVRYAWVHGDGTTASTGEPGKPYPAKDVTHRYQRPGSDLRARVDTTYSVRYSVDGGRWTDLAEPLTAPGPSTAIDVDEAVPVLTH